MMKKENIVDLIAYREQHQAKKAYANTSISDELKLAIQNLILRLRESEPIQSNS